jgi:hypothetical protein
MIRVLRKTAIVVVAALTVSAGITAAATPSMAQGWHRGWGGWGWRHGGWGWGGPVAAGVIGGLALGALASSAYAHGPYYYGGCYWQNRPVYDSWGNFAGYTPVQVCY